MEKYKELYENNQDFKEYVDRFCKEYKLPTEEALELAIVQEVGDMYESR